MTEPVLIKASIRKQFQSVMSHGRILLLSAPCGFGKSTVADALLQGRHICRLQAGAPGFSIPARCGSWEVLLLDNLQLLQAIALHWEKDVRWQSALLAALVAAEGCNFIRPVSACPAPRFCLFWRILTGPAAPNGTKGCWQTCGCRPPIIQIFCVCRWRQHRRRPRWKNRFSACCVRTKAMQRSAQYWIASFPLLRPM